MVIFRSRYVRAFPDVVTEWKACNFVEDADNHFLKVFECFKDKI